MLTAGDVFAMCANQEIIVGSMRIDVLVDEADHSGDVSLLNNATPELLAQYVPSKKLSLPYTSLLIRDKGRIFLIDSGMGNRLLENLQQKGITTEEINFILITHMHPDHIGGLVQGHKTVLPNATIYIAEKEKAFWTDSTNIETLSNPLKKIMKGPFEKAQEVLTVCKKQIAEFTPRDVEKEPKEILPGIEAIVAYGHTPGHTAYLLQSEDKCLLVLGDIFHVSEIQLAYPEVTLMFDIDENQAAKTRRAIFEYAATTMIPVMATHKPAPHFGTLKTASSEKESHIFTPLQFTQGIY